MSRYSKLIIGLICVLGTASCAMTTKPDDDGKEPGFITEAREAFLVAYNEKHDAEALSGFYTTDAHFAGVVTPRWLAGRETIQTAWARFFKRFPNAELTFYPHSVKRIGKGVYVETGCLYMSMWPPTPPIENKARYNVTRVNDGGAWRITNMHVSEPKGKPLDHKMDRAGNCFE